MPADLPPFRAASITPALSLRGKLASVDAAFPSSPPLFLPPLPLFRPESKTLLSGNKGTIGPLPPLFFVNTFPLEKRNDSYLFLLSLFLPSSRDNPGVCGSVSLLFLRRGGWEREKKHCRAIVFPWAKRKHRREGGGTLLPPPPPKQRLVQQSLNNRKMNRKSSSFFQHGLTGAGFLPPPCYVWRRSSM